MSDDRIESCSHVRVVDLERNGTDLGAEQTTSTASRVAVSTPLVARESQNETDRRATCRWHHCPNHPDKGYVFCPEHEAEWAKNKRVHEPETTERQFVRYVYADDCKLPYKPRTLDSPPARTKGYSQPPINVILAALASAGCDYRASSTVPDSWDALCPTHDDSQPSLHVKRNHDGSVWLKCWAGCSKEGILAALGLEWRDLWENNQHDAGRKRIRVAPLLEPHQRRAMQDLIRLDDDRRAA